MNKREINSEDLIATREKFMKCKLIALDEMGKHPLHNPKCFSSKEKKELLDKVTYIFDNETLENITNKFNEICNEKLFNQNADYSTYPIYVDQRFPEQQQKINDEEEDLNLLKDQIKSNN